MILKNWYKAFSAALMGVTSLSLPIQNGTMQTVNTNCSTSFVSTSNLYPCITRVKNAGLSDSVKGGVFFGNSSEPATIDDYWLKGDLIQNFAVTATAVVNSDDDGTTLTATYTITNNNDAEIVIAECVLAQCPYSGAYRYVAYDRTVLDSPVTIPAGGIGVVTYTIRLNYPTI